MPRPGEIRTLIEFPENALRVLVERQIIDQSRIAKTVCGYNPWRDNREKLQVPGKIDNTIQLVHIHRNDCCFDPEDQVGIALPQCLQAGNRSAELIPGAFDTTDPVMNDDSSLAM